MKMRKIIQDKKALGGIITTFIATIVIVAILLIFVFASAAVKKIAGVKSGVEIEKKYEKEIKNINEYFNGFGKLTVLRFLLSEQDDLGNEFYALKEVLEESGVLG